MGAFIEMSDLAGDCGPFMPGYVCVAKDGCCPDGYLFTGYSGGGGRPDQKTCRPLKDPLAWTPGTTQYRDRGNQDLDCEIKSGRAQAMPGNTSGGPLCPTGFQWSNFRQQCLSSWLFAPPLPVPAPAYPAPGPLDCRSPLWQGPPCQQATPQTDPNASAIINSILVQGQDPCFGQSRSCGFVRPRPPGASVPNEIVLGRQGRHGPTRSGPDAKTLLIGGAVAAGLLGVAFLAVSGS